MSNTNESGTISILQKILKLNKALFLLAVRSMLVHYSSRRFSLPETEESRTNTASACDHWCPCQCPRLIEDIGTRGCPSRRPVRVQWCFCATSACQSRCFELRVVALAARPSSGGEKHFSSHRNGRRRKPFSWDKPELEKIASIALGTRGQSSSNGTLGLV